MSESYSRSWARQYWLIGLVALLTCIFHSQVSHQFGRMMAGMQEAAILTRALRMEELELFHEFRESTALHLASRQNFRDAVIKEREANELLHRIRMDEMESAKVHEKESELEDEAHEDEEKASDLDYASLGDSLDYVASKLHGTSIEKRAEDEAAQASDLLEHADKLEREGAQRLAEAEARLNSTANITEIVQYDAGLCRWVSWACRGINKNARQDPNKKISESIAIASGFDEALELIDKANKERDSAMKLIQKSAKDVNESIAILERANGFRERSDTEHEEAEELHKRAKDEEKKAAQEEIVAEFEDEQIVSDKARLISSLDAMSRFAIEAREQAEIANELDFRRSIEREAIEETELRIRDVTFAAKNYVKHAGWYALLAVLLAGALLVLSLLRIVSTCMQKDPWTWIVRNGNFVIRDISYIYIHVLLLILTMAFSGDLLRTYHMHSVLGRIEIATLFASAGSFFQVTLLHFTPNMIRLASVSSLNTNTFLTLVRENVFKSGAIVFFVFIGEILFCWINFGNAIFSHMSSLNSPWLWLFVAMAGAIHVCFIEIYSSAPVVDDLQVEEGSTLQGSNQGTELKSFSEDERTHDGSKSAQSASVPSSKCNSNYGSTTRDGSTVSLSSEISSTFITSWSKQLNQLSLLLDILLASWAVWIMRHNVYIIFKLSPLSPGIVWGFFPLWMLDVFLAAILAFACFAFFSWKRRKEQEVRDFRQDFGGNYRRSTAPLLG